MLRETFPEDPHTAIAIAECESGLKQSAVGPTQDYGVMQIHAPSWDHVAREKGWDYKNNIEDNVAMARYIYEQAGKRFTPWVCYTHNMLVRR